MPTLQQQKIIFEQVGYNPNPRQWDVHKCPKRFRLVAGGERAGKSKLAAMDLMGRFYEGKLYWLVAADYERTTAEFNYICEALEKLGWNFEATKRVDPGEIIADGGYRFVTKSAKDPKKLAMEAPDGILVCEASQIDYETYLRLRYRLAEKRGWMLMSGTFESCIPAGELVVTDRGIIPIEEVNDGVSAAGLYGKSVVSNSWEVGERKTYLLTTDKNFSLRATENHKFMSLKDGEPSWVRLDELSIGDYICIRYGDRLWGTNYWSEEEAYLAGLYVAEGSCEIHGNSHRLSFANTEKEVGALLEPKGYKFSSLSLQWRLTDNKLAKTFQDMGMDLTLHAKDKVIPRGILAAQEHVVVSFLRGLFDGDGGCGGASVNLYTSSHKLAKQVQIVLANLGIIASITGTSDLCVSITHADEFLQLIGFDISRKQEKVRKIPTIYNYRGGKTKDNILHGCRVWWARVKDIKEASMEVVYDITVPNGSAFVANGCLVHNSLGWYP